MSRFKIYRRLVGGDWYLYQWGEWTYDFSFGYQRCRWLRHRINTWDQPLDCELIKEEHY